MRFRRSHWTVWTAALVGALPSLAPSATAQGPVTRVSIASNSVQANDDSFLNDFTSDGRLVVFHSWATQLVPHDGNEVADVFVHDRAALTTERVSVSSSGAEANSTSYYGSISDDGRWVAFDSLASNLVPGDTNGYRDVFLRDRVAGTTILLTVGLGGAPANFHSEHARISKDGRFVAFASWADDLVPGDTNLGQDIFVFELATGVLERASVNSLGVQGNSHSRSAVISADGRFVAFESLSSNLVPNGDYRRDVFVRDRIAGITRRASTSPQGTPGDGDSRTWTNTFSDDGRFLAFYTKATNLLPGLDGKSHVLVHDAFDGSLELVSASPSGAPSNGNSSVGAIDASGRFVSFGSSATDLVSGDTNGVGDLFVRDRATGTTRRVVAPDGTQGNGSSGSGVFSSVASRIAFSSVASNLVPADTNGEYDVFVHEVPGPAGVSYCTPKTSSQGCLPTMTLTGGASVTSPSAFLVGATQVVNQKPGLLFYGPASATLPFQGGTLCVGAPVERTTLQLSGGNPPPDDCSGSYSLDFNAWIQSGVDPGLVAAALVFAQYWYRDPASPSTTGLSDAVVFGIGP